MSSICPSCREPLDYPSGDVCAEMTRHKEKAMTHEPFYIGVEEVKEHEDGSATYTFIMDDSTSKNLTEIGLKFILYCGVAQVDMQDVFDWILKQGKEEYATDNA